MQYPLCLALSALLAAGHGAAGTPAGQGGAGGGDEAKERFLAGVGFFSAGNHEAALAEFLESYRVKPKWELQYNIGVCYMKLGKYASSLSWFERYLSEGGEKVPAERRAKVEGDIAALGKKVGRVVFCCDLEGALLVVENVEQHDSVPPEGVVVDPGIVKVELRKAGFEPFVAQVEVASGTTRSVTVEWKPLGGQPAPEPPSVIEPGTAGGESAPVAPPAAGRGKPRSAAWLGGWLGAGAALGIGAAVAGGLTLQSKGRMEDAAAACGSTATRADCPDAYGHLDRAKDLRIAANVLAALAVAAGAVGVAMYFVEKKKEKGAKATKKAAPVVTAGPLGFVLRY